MQSHISVSCSFSLSYILINNHFLYTFFLKNSLDFYENLNYRMAALQRNELIASSEQRSSNDEDFLSSPTFPTPTLYSYLQMESTTQSQPLSQSSKTLSMAPQPSKSRFPLSSSQQSKTRSLVHPNKQLQLTSPDQQTKTLVISPPLSPKKPLSPSKQSTMSLTPSRSLSPSPQFQSMLPRSMSPPLSPNKPIKSLNQQRSLPSFRSTQSQPTSPTQENSNNYPLIYNNNSNNSSPPKLKINTYPVSSNTNSNKTENNKSDDSSSPIIETFTPMSKKTSFALVSRDNLALISGWIDGLDLSSPDDASYAVTEVPYKFKLLVRGSRHGFSDKIFHKRCDNKGPTITVIKLKGVDGIVIGGYNPVKWQSPLMRKFEKCHHSFVFSLKPNQNDRTYATIKAMQDEEMLEDSLACKYNISNRNLIMNTTPLQHNSLFSRATYSKYAVNLCKGTGPAFGTTDLVMKDGEVTFKSDCYSLDFLKKIGGEMDNEDVKSYTIEEYEVYLLLKRR